MFEENKKFKENKNKNKNKKSHRRFDVEKEISLLNKRLFIAFVLLFVLFVFEAVLIFIPFRDMANEIRAGKHIAQAVPVAPVYIVDSQKLDIDTYLRQYFASKKPRKIMMVTVSAYSSAKNQTDNTPYKTAYNTFVRDGIVAANFLPVGTVVRFSEKFGDKFFVVEDKMDERYGLHADIWMSKYEDAKNFGLQYLEMEIF